jgi:hypothetical protein
MRTTWEQEVREQQIREVREQQIREDLEEGALRSDREDLEEGALRSDWEDLEEGALRSDWEEAFHFEQEKRNERRGHDVVCLEKGRPQEGPPQEKVRMMDL